MKRILPIAFLLGLAIVQLGFIVVNRSSSVDSADPAPLWLIEAGDTLFSSPILPEDRRLLDVLNGGDTGAAGVVVLSFGSDCAHSRAVAGAWREWLSEDRAMRIVAVTRDDEAAAAGYVATEGWSVELLSLLDPPSGSVSAALTTLTPATYLLDSDGVVHFQGHGSDLDGLDTAIERLASSMSAEVPL